MTDYELPPGSEKARGEGCKCPVIDNNRGMGRFRQREEYVFRSDCPIHSPDD